MQVDWILLREELLVYVLATAEERLLILSVELDFQLFSQIFVEHYPDLGNALSEIRLCCFGVSLIIEGLVNFFADFLFNDCFTTGVAYHELLDIVNLVLINYEFLSVLLA